MPEIFKGSNNDDYDDDGDVFPPVGQSYHRAESWSGRSLISWDLKAAALWTPLARSRTWSNIIMIIMVMMVMMVTMMMMVMMVIHRGWSALFQIKTIWERGWGGS